MLVLTPSERRLAALVATLLALGAVHDLWPERPPRPRSTIAAPPESLSATAGAANRPAAAPESSGLVAADRPAPDRDAPPAVDLNTASAAQLDALPGIGPVLARRIVDHRTRYGPFRDPRDIRAVTGIGPKLYARIEPYLHVRSETPAPPR